MRFQLRWRTLCCFLILCLGTLAAGCQVFGVLASAAPDPTVDASYKGLAHQRVAVMVWCDHAMAIDWPNLQIDLTRGIQGRLQDMARKKDHPKELEGATFPMPESVVKFQRDHPELEAEAITDVAPRMDVSRLIYIEVQQFATRPQESVELFRGSLTANLKVLEVSSGKAKVVFQQEKLQAEFPPKSLEEGTPSLGDVQTYEKTLEAFSTKVVNLFVPHVEPREEFDR